MRKMILLTLIFSLIGTLFSCTGVPVNRGEVGKGQGGPVNPGPEDAMRSWTPGSKGEVGKGQGGPVNPGPEDAMRSWTPGSKGEVGKGQGGPVNPGPEDAMRFVDYRK